METGRNDFQLRSCLSSPFTIIQDDYYNPQRNLVQQSVSGSQELVEFGITPEEDLEFVKRKNEKEQLVEFIQRHAEILLEKIVRSMIHELMTSKGLQERIGMKSEEINTLNPEEILFRLGERLGEERQLKENFPEFLR